MGGWQSHVPVQRNGWLSSSSVATRHNPNKFGFRSRCSIGCRKPLLETDGACACIPFRDKMLQAAIPWWMKENHYHHDFRLWLAAFTVILALSFFLKRIFCHLCIKNFAKIICNTEIFNELYFIELTLIYMYSGFVSSHLWLTSVQGLAEPKVADWKARQGKGTGQ